MEDRQQRRFASFLRILELPAQWKREMADPHVTRLLDALRTIVDEVAKLDLQMQGLKGGTGDRAEQIKAWTQTLRQEHLMPLQTAAEMYLEDAEGTPLKLKVPPYKARPVVVLNHVVAFNQTLRPHLSTLVANGMSPDILDRMDEPFYQLRHLLVDVPTEKKSHKAARDKLDALISRGLKTVKLLRRSLKPLFRDHTLFRDHFETAAKILDKPGPNKQNSTAATRDRRDRRHRKRPLARPRKATLEKRPDADQAQGG